MASASVPSNRQTAVLQRNLEELRQTPLEFIRDLQIQSNEGCNEVTGVMIGPKKTQYEDKPFNFILKFPPEYPFKPPMFYFLSPITHPNISLKDGFACHDQLMLTWTPRKNLVHVLTEIQALLANPNYDSPVDKQ